MACAVGRAVPAIPGQLARATFSVFSNAAFSGLKYSQVSHLDRSPSITFRQSSRMSASVCSSGILRNPSRRVVELSLASARVTAVSALASRFIPRCRTSNPSHEPSRSVCREDPGSGRSDPDQRYMPRQFGLSATATGTLQPCLEHR